MWKFLSQERYLKGGKKCGTLFSFFSSCSLYSSCTVHSLSRDLEERLHKKGKNRALVPEVLQSRTFAAKKKKKIIKGQFSFTFRTKKVKTEIDICETISLFHYFYGDAEE